MDTYVLDPNYLLDVTIQSTENPVVMRRLSVPATVNFHDIHLIIQIAFGWGQCHPYKFSIEEQVDDGLCEDPLIIELNLTGIFALGLHSPKSSKDTLFSDVLKDVQQHKKILLYRYGTDDGWNHRIEFVGFAEESTEAAVCIAGEGHPCAEDVGGPSGWRELKLAYKNIHDESDFRAIKRRIWHRQDCMSRDPEGLAGNGPYRWDRKAVNQELDWLKLGPDVEEYGEYEDEDAFWSVSNDAGENMSWEL